MLIDYVNRFEILSPPAIMTNGVRVM